MDVGRGRRLKRILGRNDRTVMVPMDHGVAPGPVTFFGLPLTNLRIRG